MPCCVTLCENEAPYPSCKNGHTICKECVIKLGNNGLFCPQCRDLSTLAILQPLSDKIKSERNEWANQKKQFKITILSQRMELMRLKELVQAMTHYTNQQMEEEIDRAEKESRDRVMSMLLDDSDSDADDSVTFTGDIRMYAPT